jgi:hypothetical protein
MRKVSELESELDSGAALLVTKILDTRIARAEIVDAEIVCVRLLVSRVRLNTRSTREY